MEDFLAWLNSMQLLIKCCLVLTLLTLVYLNVFKHINTFFWLHTCWSRVWWPQIPIVLYFHVCQKPLFAINVFLKIQSWLVKQTIKYMANLMYLGGNPQKVSKHVCLMHTGWVSCRRGELVQSINWSPLCHLSCTGIRRITLRGSKSKYNAM